jgi:hypothetical protein
MNLEAKAFAFDGLAVQVEIDGFATRQIQPGNLTVNNAVRFVEANDY